MLGSKPVIESPPAGAEAALETWNLMGGELAWDCMDYACENFMVSNVELLVKQLCAIRDYFTRKSRKDNGESPDFS